MSRFRLAGLLRLRKMQEDTAAAELARRSMHRRESERLESKALAAIGEHRLEASGNAESWIASVAARSAYSASVDMARAAGTAAIAVGWGYHPAEALRAMNVPVAPDFATLGQMIEEWAR